MLRTRFFAVVVVLGLLMAPAWAQTAAPAQPTVAISNDSCPGGVQLTQIIWLREEQVIGLQLLQVLIRMGQTYTVKAELGVMPTAVVVRGIAAGSTHRGTRPHGAKREVQLRNDLHNPAWPNPAHPGTAHRTPASASHGDA
jgi:hypothetical protein